MSAVVAAIGFSAEFCLTFSLLSEPNEGKVKSDNWNASAKALVIHAIIFSIASVCVYGCARLIVARNLSQLSETNRWHDNVMPMDFNSI